MIDVNFGYFIHKCAINSLVVHPKFDTGAAKNLWRAASGPRTAVWPPLVYIKQTVTLYSKINVNEISILISEITCLKDIPTTPKKMVNPKIIKDITKSIKV